MKTSLPAPIQRMAIVLIAGFGSIGALAQAVAQENPEQNSSTNRSTHEQGNLCLNFRDVPLDTLLDRKSVV